MFDLIDDLSTDVWEDKGTPPDNLEEVADIKEYVNYQIVSRKVAPMPMNSVRYATTDEAGKNIKHVVVKGCAPNIDPLKNVRHFRAKTKDSDDGDLEAFAILLDMDWCIKK